MPNHFDDLSRFLAELITADPGVAGPVRPSAPREMLDSPDASFLRHVAVCRCDARIGYVLLKGDWRPIAWGALALPGATRQLERAAIYEFGQLPALDGGLGIFDTPAWRRSANALFVGIAPSDFADASTYSYVDPCLTFIRIVRATTPPRHPPDSSSAWLESPAGHHRGQHLSELRARARPHGRHLLELRLDAAAGRQSITHC